MNQRDELVLTWARWVMVHRKVDTARNTTHAPPPSFAAFVSPEDIASVASCFAPVSADTLGNATGSNSCWEDIALNVTIPHTGGMTIDETDHTLATKLYQNTARVHFDLHHMKDSRFGRRLVYGGQIISICRALSFDGLQNALTIAAINAGSHLNPTFAGDTIYATSTPSAKWPISPTIGALRLQLNGYKNIDPSVTAITDEHSAQHVLSLDLTVLMPRH
jgi:2-methylfumaryl-CoA hydratase